MTGVQTCALPISGATENVSVNTNIEDIKFWSWGYGYLYDVYTIINIDDNPTDVVRTRTGFRKTAFRNGMVYLNDRVLQLKGYAQRTSNEWPSVGMSVPAWLSDYSNRLIVEGNGNLVRWMHVTPWKQDIESCDRVGLLQAMPAGDAEKDVDGRQWDVREELMRDAIIYNRNNPSIIFYESGNESISEEHMARMKAIRDEYDPYGGRAIGSREMLDSKISEYGGEMLYINKSGAIPMWATEYCRDEALRKYWDEYSFPYHKDGEGSSEYRSTVTNTVNKKSDTSAYNRNQDSFAKETVIRWFDYFRLRPGTGRRVSSGGVNIVFSDTNTHYRGAENYRCSGEVDAMRIPKDAFFAHKVMWDGWVDIENHSTHIIGHWNYEPDTRKDITVVSTGQQVELFINGKSCGKGDRSYNFLFTFSNIKWEPGILEAVSYDADGMKQSVHQLKTTGEPTNIKLSLMQAPDGFKADGADIAMIEVEVTDKDGNRVPLANDMITFDLNGPAEWRGGIAQGENNCILSKNLPVECGVNRFFIRSTTKSGNISLKATAKDLKSASLRLKSKPVATSNGLSSYVSADYLPVNLSRGETPGSCSFKEARRTINIIDAITETNNDKAMYSFDDNELSEWGNDGKLNTGWIIYELERDALISEIDMKLAGWRMRSYPIRILIDDKEVFKGDTPKSLGYINIPFEPVEGRFVKIELIGMSKDNDAFGGIVEVTGKKEIDLNKDPKNANKKGQLRIVEIDVYESVE